MRIRRRSLANSGGAVSDARGMASWGSSAMSFYSYITGTLSTFFALLLLIDLYGSDHSLLVRVIYLHVTLGSILIAFVALVLRRVLPLWVGALLAGVYSAMALFSLLHLGWANTVTGSMIQVLPLVAMFVGSFFAPKQLSRSFTYGYVVVAAVTLILTGNGGLVSIPRAFSIIVSIIFSLEMGIYGRRRALEETMHDPLTGVLNRRGLMYHAEYELEKTLRNGNPMALVLIDFNGFKELNDREGHLAGDRVLQNTVAQWRRALPKKDLIGRLGGDEFVILFPQTDLETVHKTMHRLAVEAQFSWSWGTSLLREHDTIDTMLARADERMYRNKPHNR